MAIRGRKPAPVEQRKLHNPSKRPIPEPLMVSGRPTKDDWAEPPEWLHDDAKEFWRFAVDRLVDVGVVDRVDVPVLEQLATQYARIRGAQRVIAEVGYFTRGSQGQIVEHPALKIERQATVIFLQIAEHYALTPIARTRLGLAELHRRNLSSEMERALGDVELTPVDVTAE